MASRYPAIPVAVVDAGESHILQGMMETALERIIRKQTTPQNKAKRAHIILLENDEMLSNIEIAERLNIYPCDVTRWTKRWIDRTLESAKERPEDYQRSVAPDRITAEQWFQIIALACEPTETQTLRCSHLRDMSIPA